MPIETHQLVILHDYYSVGNNHMVVTPKPNYKKLQYRIYFLFRDLVAEIGVETFPPKRYYQDKLILTAEEFRDKPARALIDRIYFSASFFFTEVLHIPSFFLPCSLSFRSFSSCFFDIVFPSAIYSIEHEI